MQALSAGKRYPRYVVLSSLAIIYEAGWGKLTRIIKFVRHSEIQYFAGSDAWNWHNGLLASGQTRVVILVGVYSGESAWKQIKSNCDSHKYLGHTGQVAYVTSVYKGSIHFQDSIGNLHDLVKTLCLLLRIVYANNLVLLKRRVFA